MNLDALALRSLLVVLGGLLVAHLVRRRSAATRHLVYAGTLLSLVLLPVLRQWVPSASVPVDRLPIPVRSFAERMDKIQAVTFTIPSLGGHAQSSNLRLLAVDALIALWVAGSLLVLIRLGLGLVQISRVVRRSRRLDLSEFGPFEVRMSHAVTVPSTTWLGRSVILLPAGYEAWSPDRLRSVILHEAAHIGRGDWFVQFFGRLACALYWPNPAVWLAQRRMTEVAEQAADDLVLKAGVAPSDYAEDLLQIARSVRRGEPALTISMALKGDIARRIEMVLDNNKRRGSVQLGGLMLAAVGIALVSVPAANLLLGKQGGYNSLVFSDLNDRKMSSGSASNGYSAKLGDGREIQLTQISWDLPDGTVEAWRPDGTVISPKNTVRRQYNGPDETERMEFLYRVKANGELTHAGMEMAPGAASASEEEIFADGWATPGTKDGNMTVVCDMKIRDRGRAEPQAFVFYVVDGPPLKAASYDVVTGSVKNNGEFLMDMEVFSQAIAHPLLFAKDGELVLDAGGNQIRKDVPAIVVSYDEPVSPLSYSADPIGITRDGRRIKANFMPGTRVKNGPRRLAGWFPRNAGIERIELEVRDLRATEIQGVHVRPDTLVSH